MEQGTIAPSGTAAIGGFDALRILDNGFSITIGSDEYAFETPKDAYGRIIAVNGGGKNRKITYERSFAGVEYEQVYSDLPSLVPPNINHVGVETLGLGSYRLSMSSADYTLDSRAEPFFFFYSSAGIFEDYVVGANGSASVIFKASPVAGEYVRVVAGVGDNLGQVHRNTVFL